jgi:hypothetical protein
MIRRTRPQAPRLNPRQQSEPFVRAKSEQADDSIHAATVMEIKQFSLPTPSQDEFDRVCFPSISKPVAGLTLSEIRSGGNPHHKWEPIVAVRRIRVPGRINNESSTPAFDLLSLSGHTLETRERTGPKLLLRLDLRS